VSLQNAFATLGWFHFRDHPQAARHAGVLERDEARRLATNELLRRLGEPE
jgi:hypothetical protein